jgi:hypothetical protein
MFRNSGAWGGTPFPTWGNSFMPGNNTATINLTGRGVPGGLVSIYQDEGCQGTALQTVSVDGNGNWSANNVLHTPPQTVQDYSFRQAIPISGGTATGACSPSQIVTPAAPQLLSTNPSGTAPTTNITVNGVGAPWVNLPDGRIISYTVFLFADPNCVTKPLGNGQTNSSTGAFSIGVTVDVNAQTTIFGFQRDSENDAGPCSSALANQSGFPASGPPSSVQFTSSGQAANVTITGTTPGSPSTVPNPSVQGVASGSNVVGGNVRIFNNSACNGSGGGDLTASPGFVNSSGFWSANLNPLPQGTTTLYAAIFTGSGATCNPNGFQYTVSGGAFGGTTLNLQQNGPYPVFNGFTTPNSTVYLYIDSCTASQVAGQSFANSSGFFTIQSRVGIGSTRTFFANAQTSGGGFTTCSGGVPASPTR